ncbi:TonB-dependent receptor [Sphingomonas sp. NSE70-1]|uniref:TonB-dependent receptor n=1 Tax=Sphingomonas caseinilyticus TaxID=2908205 RepID=A0ABT0RU92_9SPHN|nr:TonB-dependent receptor [Sphingomonas caseinilyticus]MCL6698592.1 TonB-dependent receptor [Sphingomonas caseinilyticus]
MNSNRGNSSTDSRGRLKGATALWCMLAAALAAEPAAAQDAAAPAAPVEADQPADSNAEAQPQAAQESGDEIVVTGYRQSLKASLEDKRRAAGVIDVIKAEDIADFPDNNLAESIQRIPGVAIMRDQGEGRNISVRGLSPQFTRVRINGIEGMSTTGGADASGGANRSRQFDFNVFASDLFNSITVRKTPSADIEEGSLGATVDLVTARPFDYADDFVFAGSAQAGYNDFSESVDPRLSALVSKRFADDRIGILLSAAYSTREIMEEGPSTVRWEPASSNGGFHATSTRPTGATDNNYFHPRIPRYDSYKYDTERLGLTGTLQFEPTDRTMITIDALYSKFDSKRAEQYLEALSFSRSGTGKPQTVILPGAVVEDNSLVYGVFNNVDVRVESRYDELETKFTQYTASISHEFSDQFSIDLLGGKSKSKFENPIQTTIALDALNVQGYSFDFRDGRFPTFDYGNLDVTDPARFTLGEIRLRPQYVDNDFSVLRGEAKYEISPEFTLKGGLDWKKYKFDSKEYRRASETTVPVLAPGQLATLTELYGMETGLPGATPERFLVPIIDAFASDLDIYCNCGMFTLQGLENATARSNWRTVDEKDFGIYGQADFNLYLGDVRLRGNVGARWVQTKQNSTGYTNTASGFVLTEADRKYDYFLPSLNVAADITQDFVLRGAIAKVISRPDIGTLNPGGAFSVSGGNRTFARGNPDIKPIEAITYDLSAEWYFAPESALIVGLFYKDIKSFIATTAQQIPFSDLGLPDSILPPGTLPSDLFTVTQPINSDGGKLKGAEIGLQAPFRFLPAPFDNFGIQANYTFVDSKVDYPLSAAAGAAVIREDLVGLSRHTANGTLYYEDKKFSVRASLSYRSDFLTQVPGRNSLPLTNSNANLPLFNDVEGTNSTLNVDMSASYWFTDNFQLTFEGVNLTDEYVDQFIDSEANRLSVYHHTGRQFYGGFRFKF